MVEEVRLKSRADIRMDEESEEVSFAPGCLKEEEVILDISRPRKQEGGAGC